MMAAGNNLSITGQTVMRWIKLFDYTCKEDAQSDKIEEETEIDEMHHFIGKKMASLDLENTWSGL